jgi:serine/threonine protein kinase
MMTPMLLKNRYQVIRVLGSGGFGETFLAGQTLTQKLQHGKLSESSVK